MSFARDITTVGGGTLISRLLAFARDAMIAAVLGSGPFSEAFFVVLQIVNFFRRLLSEGALNGAFVPVWLKLRGGEDGAANADRFTKRSLLTMLCVTGIVALLAVVLARSIIAAIAPGFDEPRRQLSAFYLLIVAPYIAIAGVVAVIAAALNAEGRVGAATISTVAFNVVMVLVLLFSLRNSAPFEMSVTLSIAIVAAGLVQLAIGAAAWLSTGRRWRRPRAHVPDQIRPLFTRAIPGLIAAGIPQLKLIAGAAIASASPAAVAWLYYANRLYELPLGMASIAIAAVIVPSIASGVRAGNDKAFAAAQSRAFEIALGLALPAATGFAVLAMPIAGGLFERGAFTARDTAAVAAALSAICAGLPGHVLEKVFGAVSFAHEDTRTPMLAAFGGLAAAVAGGLLLFPRYGHTGVAAAISVSGWVGAAALGTVLSRRGWLRLDADARRRLPRIGLATAVMGAIVASALAAGHALMPAAAASSWGRIAFLFALVALGVAVYLVALQLLGAAKLDDMLAAIRRKP